ncbi:unnamed protein product [Zymoseptoria tritici ST99CH_3D7]|uniref:Uncharacterized protein n=1 Tax=Zymoseptoria tritici (strain ST99CH_3D7) TaxID=1276538 RepID=A0A1X7RQV6_ZYMT9|nr:unnamed protein product [Zymoseptoria tritici ST99CH_3D7]
MPSKRPPHHRRLSWQPDQNPLTIRIGSRRSSRKYHQIQVAGAKDAGRFARLVGDQVRAHPRDPLVISINGFQPWLGDVIHSCIEDYWSDISELDRSVQFGSTMQFPEKASKRGKWIPWTFIVDHMNVPQVYYWSVGMTPPKWEERDPTIDSFRFRTGVWFCGRGACVLDREVSVTIVFTLPNAVSEHVVTELMFDYLWRDEDFDQPREDEEGICWTFSRLYYLITDWQNILGEVLARLGEAEANSHGRHLPVKTRTRRMHMEVDRIYEMKKFLRFHMRAFSKLQKLKLDVPKDEQQDPLWDDMDDAIEDLEQFDSTLDGLKDRFNNLIELEFNITNAVQSENSGFLSAVATLFLPVSFLASLFGITTITWPASYYLWAVIPVFLVSVAFTTIFPWAKRRMNQILYPNEDRRLRLRPDQFTMLGNELPDNVNAGNLVGQGRIRTGGSRSRSLSRRRSLGLSRSRSRMRGEKSGY